MKKRWRIVSLIAIALGMHAVCFSQQFALAVTELQKIRDGYADSGYSSFSVKYQYAKKSAPGKVLDTLTIQYKMKGSDFYCKVDQIEFFQNDSINVAVYHKNKMIILSNPSMSTDKGRMAIDSWDSSFVATYIDSVNISDNKNSRTLNFYFTDNAPYSSCTIVYNNKTYRTQKMSYVERSSEYLEEDSDKPEGIIITMHFSAVSKTAFNTSVFSEKKFITKQNDNWILGSAYNDYKLINNVYKYD